MVWRFAVTIRTSTPLLRHQSPAFVYHDGLVRRGQSYIRKVDESASEIVGRTVYQDTNNSAATWIPLDEPALLHGVQKPIKRKQP